ncbi:MAG: hypothetical protein PHW64_01910 [Sulfuricurvum sp.]|nr:hypothetical protein [Sulfuricurvum sp.]
MQEWMRKHKQVLSISLGALLIVMAGMMLFWDNTGTPAASEAKRATQKVQSNPVVILGSSSSQTPSGESPIMKAYREKQAEHLRYTLIVMIIGGLGFMLYGWISKKRE